jgi:hypothetical protein
MNPTDVKARAEKIARDASDVRQQTRDLVLDVLRSGGEAVGRFPQTVEKVLAGAHAGVEQVAKERQADVLREVIDGVTEGFAKGAEAVKLTVEEARDRGQQFATDEVKGTVNDLRALESLLVERLGRMIKSGVSLTATQSADLLSHAKRAGKGMQPSISSAITAAEKDPLGLAKDTASVAAGASRRAVGSLFQALGGVLDGVGEVISGKPENDITKQ